MALYRQSGTERYGARGNHDLHHHHYANGTSSSSSDHIAIGIRANGGTSQHSKATRVRRLARPDKSRRFNVASVLVVLSFVLAVTVLAYYCISGYSNNDINNNDKKETNSYHAEDDDLKNDTDFLTNVTRTTTFKVLGFGHGSVSHGRDSRYWDRDDRRRDDDYNEDAVENTSKASEDGSLKKDHVSLEVKNKNKKTSLDDSHEGTDQRGVGLYNEAGRNELKKYEAEYEASMKNGVQSRNEYDNGHQILDGNNFGVHHEAVEDDVDYEDAIDSHDFRKEEYDDAGHDQRGHSDIAKLQKNSDFHLVGTKDQNIAKEADKTVSNREESSSAFGDFGGLDVNSRVLKFTSGQSMKISKSDPKKRSKRRKFSGSSCEMKFLNSTAQLVEPLESRKFARFSLQYSEVEEKPDWEEAWKPRFAGHQSLQEREESFLAHDQKINCGFVKGPKGSQSTGFDLSEDDENYISRCHIAVISCIFGNSDRLRTPAGKTVSRLSRKNVCFVMFMDEVTLQTLASEGQSPDRTGFIGLWKIVVVRNLPYEDMRRVGKIPKLLPHRLFPSARYSIWLDSKLRLQLDPLLILEYFLWRKGHEYAISNHYDRHCVWEEVAQNKKLNKYNPTVIDQQFAFYQADGLTRFNASDPNKLLPSNVPEGSFIVRAHTPMSNLFSCLWFNEVDRFTSRDQLSFAYTYQKLRRMNPEKPFYLHMFKDCERRAIAKLFRHRSDEKRNVYQQAIE